MKQDFFINDILQVHKTNEIRPETQQLLDSDMYLHKKFSKCTERNPIVKPSRNWDDEGNRRPEYSKSVGTNAYWPSVGYALSQEEQMHRAADCWL